VMGTLLLRATKDQFEGQAIDSSVDPATLPLTPAKDQFKVQLVDSP
jgi:hypothetical protein